MTHRIVHVNDLERSVERIGSEVDVAVVIDVVRAFTVAAWCLERGAARLLLAPSIEAAVAAGERHPGAVLLKDGEPDPRFILPNAPGRIATEDLTGRIVVQKTGNGTLRERAPDPDFPGVHPDDLGLAMEIDRFDRALRCEVYENLLEVAWV